MHCLIFLIANVVQLHSHLKQNENKRGEKGQYSRVYISFVLLNGQKTMYCNVD